MRTTILLIILFPLCNALGAQIKFSPPGAEWNFAFIMLPQWGPEKSLLRESIVYTRDSILAADTARVLSHRMYYSTCYNYQTGYKETLLLQKGDTVFFRNARTQHKWQILFNFACTAGQGWQTSILKSDNSVQQYSYTVNAVSTVVINGVSLRRLHVGTDTIIERIGWKNKFLFDFMSYANGCDGYYFAEFLCYKDNAMPLVQFGTTSCDLSVIAGEGSEWREETPFRIFPNPGREEILLQTADKTGSVADEIRLIDLTGSRQLRTEPCFSNGTATVDITGLAPGVYFLQLLNGGKIFYSGKIVRE